MPQPARYAAIQIALHWGVVILIVVQLLTGGLMESYFRALMRAGEDRPELGAAVWHMVSGAMILVFMLTRLALRFTHGVPPPVAGSPGWDVVLSRLNHWLFYVVLIAMPVVGLSAYLIPSRPLANLHASVVPVLLVLVALHILGALYHQFIRKDGLIRRMTTPERGVERVPPARPR
ncbi:cytochrome b/b6 domain-containing protein [Paracoccus sp. Z118]|uniref:cytochrome b n=1 Tax=Paracoccus sp. Z118 TaxID=2851017 RepID=UPI001C2BC5C2|nr:cytochrome b/b6 domain-containing protein [Paracoccus sp. Z118]MBV0893321.1 cytochrome b/b6 domain-containing protein [Paracoccus sp. Z118]